MATQWLLLLIYHLVINRKVTSGLNLQYSHTLVLLCLQLFVVNFMPTRNRTLIRNVPLLLGFLFIVLLYVAVMDWWPIHGGTSLSPKDPDKDKFKYIQYIFIPLKYGI